MAASAHPKAPQTRQPGSAFEPRARATHHVHMKMVDFLPAFKPRVYHDAKATIWIRVAALFQCQPRRQRHHAPEQARIVCRDLRHRRDMALGNHEEVHRGPRMDVMKRENFFVFVDLLRWNLASGDFAKKAVRIVHGEGQIKSESVIDCHAGWYAQCLSPHPQPLKPKDKR